MATPVNFSYDLNGNLLSDGNRAFDYDDENELVRVTVTNSWKSEFTYDGLMRMRIRKEFAWSGSWVETNEVRYIYDGNLVIQERDGNNLPLVTYTRGKDLSGGRQGAGGIGGLLARTDMTLAAINQPATSYYHADGNGNVTAMVNAKQVLVAKYLYDPYGNILSQSGPLADANVYRFSSKEFQRNSGLYAYGYRFYEPNLQRWINRDPIQEWGGINLYGFVQNSPVDFIDLYGWGDYYGGDDLINVNLGSDGKTTAADILRNEDEETRKRMHQIDCEGKKKLKDAATKAGKELATQLAILAMTEGMGNLAEMAAAEGAEIAELTVAAKAADTAADALADAANAAKKFSKEKEALVDMAQADKRTGITRADMDAYKQLNKDLPDPFPENKVRGPEVHPDRGPQAQQPHGHVGPVGYIPIQ